MDAVGAAASYASQFECDQAFIVRWFLEGVYSRERGEPCEWDNGVATSMRQCIRRGWLYADAQICEQLVLL